MTPTPVESITYVPSDSIRVQVEVDWLATGAFLFFLALCFLIIASEWGERRRARREGVASVRKALQ